ncbi:hypothetical protein CBI38_12985 [Rhodococcus oxybenzonivorans]|uniref:DUF402 domain-containing protein n=1 Tax=Rhodococcus oxybenzonivorans TaxID=1990687 RepID=A0A2S2BUN5_9NOCA|nr:DUF402 domain-containing protein [Rhodococcus oxybenzonivorans]AWK72355.1 hypothetical protein CBI38_12985 [Rhodococcus oxybenzonivorans]
MEGAAHPHPPKIEYFDLRNSTNTDPKGFVRPVEQFRVEPWGLYMARTADHRQFDYLESWLLPDLGLRASIFHFRPEHRRDQDHYVDIGVFTRGDDVWTSEDHYLDLVVRTGRSTELLDVDELMEAHSAGLLDTATAEKAITTAVAAIEGLATHGHDLGRWLASLGMPIDWR